MRAFGYERNGTSDSDEDMYPGAAHSDIIKMVAEDEQFQHMPVIIMRPQFMFELHHTGLYAYLCMLMHHESVLPMSCCLITVG